MKHVNTSTRKKLTTLLVLAMTLSTSGHALAGSEGAPAVGDYEFLSLALDPTRGEFPEGMAVDRQGNLYFSLSPRGEIWRATPDGDLTLMAVLDSARPKGAAGALGLVTRHGNIYAAVMACNAKGCNDSHGVWRIRGQGHKSKLPGTGHIGWPNALAFGARGELYVSDSVTGAIWVLYRRGRGRPWLPGPLARAPQWRQMPSCECVASALFRGGPRRFRACHGPAWHRKAFQPAELWIQDGALHGNGLLGLGAPIGANGLAYSRDRNEVLVANTETGSVLAIPIGPKGKAGEIELVAHGPALLTVDGIAVDRYGDILALTVGRAGAEGLEPVAQLLHVDRESGEIDVVLAGEPLFFPTSLAFGRRTGSTQSVFVANWAVLAPMFGMTPKPGIVCIDLRHRWDPKPDPED